MSQRPRTPVVSGLDGLSGDLKEPSCTFICLNLQDQGRMKIILMYRGQQWLWDDSWQELTSDLFICGLCLDCCELCLNYYKIWGKVKQSRKRSLNLTTYGLKGSLISSPGSPLSFPPLWPPHYPTSPHFWPMHFDQIGAICPDSHQISATPDFETAISACGRFHRGIISSISTASLRNNRGDAWPGGNTPIGPFKRQVRGTLRPVGHSTC